ncbi:MAG: signal peptidase I [Clostridia bacterium]|nr:signal peptidase I [Clostridia bacterium]
MKDETIEKQPGQQDDNRIGMIEAELKRVNHNIRFRRLLQSTINTLIVVAACAVLVAVLYMPVFRIYGNSMVPTLNPENIIVSVKSKNIVRGDLVCMYYGNKVLVKRVIASSGEWVDIDEEGNVYVYTDQKGDPLDESYLAENAKAFGECDIELPYQVPANAIFVMGDKRDTSIDSRNSSVGCIDLDEIIGKIEFRIWPLTDFGFVN